MKNISKLLKIHRRISACKFCVQMIEELDDAYGPNHILATVNGLDMISSKSFVQNNPATSSSLMSWMAGSLRREIRAGRLPPDANKEQGSTAFNRFLLKRRLINYLLRKLCLPNTHPAHASYQKLVKCFSSWAAFEASGLDGTTKVTSEDMSWLQDLPEFLSELSMFLANIVKGTSGALETQLETDVKKDPTIQPEVVLNSVDFKTNVFNLEEMLAVRNNLLEKAAEPPAPTPAPSPAPQPAPSAPAPEEGDILPDGLAAGAEDGEPKPSPTRLDKISKFSSMLLHQSTKDLFDRLADPAFEEVLDWSTLRSLPFLGLGFRGLGFPEYCVT